MLHICAYSCLTNVPALFELHVAQEFWSDISEQLGIDFRVDLT